MLTPVRVSRPSLTDIDSICLRCLYRLSKATVVSTQRRRFSHSPPRLDLIATKPKQRDGYFSHNSLLGIAKLQAGNMARVNAPFERKIDTGERSASTESSSIQLPARTPSESPSAGLYYSPISELPHRRRKRLKGESTTSLDLDPIIPPDASSRLATVSTSLPPSSLRRLFTTCLSLSKPRLSFLMVLTTTTAYSLYPVPAVLLPTTTISPSLSALTLVFLTSGTALCCASANALNMLLEPEHDAKMTRTRNRPLVRGLITKRGAFVFASIAGAVGVGSLWFGVNPTVAFLGGINIFLYAAVYTPMKRLSVLNTWAGAVVGGIPPLMGWAAAAGQSASGNGEWQELLLGDGSIGGWLLAGLLFTWQFPHFNAFSWTIKEEYKNAGYRMLAWTNPKMNGRVALRYSFFFFPICFGLWWYGITDQGFLVTSSIVNVWIVREAWRFWAKEGQKGSARGLFWASIWHLPVIMVLAMAHKKGLWEGVWGWAIGEDTEEDPWLDGEEETRTSKEKKEGSSILEPILHVATAVS